MGFWGRGFWDFGVTLFDTGVDSWGKAPRFLGWDSLWVLKAGLLRLWRQSSLGLDVESPPLQGQDFWVLGTGTPSPGVGVFGS